MIGQLVTIDLMTLVVLISIDDLPSYVSVSDYQTLLKNGSQKFIEKMQKSTSWTFNFAELFLCIYTTVASILNNFKTKNQAVHEWSAKSSFIQI